MPLLLVVSVAFNQENPEKAPPLLRLDIKHAEVPVEYGLTITDAEAEYIIDLDPYALANDPEVLSLDLYEGIRLEARRFKTRQYNGWRSWSGDLYFPDILGSKEPAGEIVVVDHGDHISGIINIYATQEDFQIVGLPDGEHRLIKMKRNRIQSCGTEMETDGSTSAVATALSAPSPPMIESVTQESQIDVLAIVFSGQMSQATDDFISSSISIANNVFDYNGIEASYNLVGTVEANPYTEVPMQGSVTDYLKYMDGGGFDAIENLRATAGSAPADMVALFVGSGTSPSSECARANWRYRLNNHDYIYVDPNATNLQWSPGPKAYSVHKIGCGLNDYTFAHELGHNFSLRHDYNDPGSSAQELLTYPPIESNPRGYEFMTWMGSRATVMGCYGTSAPCDRTHYYSDPQTYWYGFCPTGDEADPYVANAATILKHRVLEYSLFK
jgi:hypothetical protein